jgi:hypothetical protein
VREFVENRAEAMFGLTTGDDLARPCIAAAVAMVRLDELAQSHVRLFGKLLRTVLTSQEPDGGWGDPVATALCLRALMCSRGQGVAIERGLQYLTNLQKSEGIWPKEPIRRLDADPVTSAFILFELGGSEEFRRVVRFGDAVRWFQQSQEALESHVQELWERVARRCDVGTARPAQMLVWS